MITESSMPPQPRPDADSQSYWVAARAGRLVMCRCQRCGLWLQPPLERCRRCAGATSFEEMAGTGTVYSFIVQHRPVAPGYLEAPPYVVALVELDEQPGLRLPGRLPAIDPGDVMIGQRVLVGFEDLPGGDYRIPVFRIDDAV